MAGVGVVLGQPQGPRNVEQITKASQDYEYDAAVPLRYWLRTAGALLKEAEIYGREGDDETTYFLLFRHAHLILAQLPQHPQAREKGSRVLLKKAEEEVDKNLKLLDLLKPKINERYDRHTQLRKEREARKHLQIRRTASFEEQDRQDDSQNRRQSTQMLHAHDHKDLAVRIAQRESSRREGTRRAPADDTDGVPRRLEAIHARLEREQPAPPTFRDSRTSSAFNKSPIYRYPSVPAQHIPQPPLPTLTQSWKVDQSGGVVTPPSLPPKPSGANHDPPTRPEKVSDQAVRSAPPETSYTFAASAYLENGSPLRPLFIPPTLRTTFLRIAHQNTLANLETCAFLAGTLSANAFFVSRLVVPAQTSTSDTCEMTNESQLFDYVDSEDLMILGWIHTHPTQTCFMSSRDLHTHAGYQMMLAESVAIVCAPSKGDTTHGGDWGVYRLTDPPGKKAILSCEKPGLFHPHDVDNVYTDALKPGHVVEVKGLEFEVVDLR